MKFKTLIAPIIALVTSTGTTHGTITPYQELEERNTLIASILIRLELRKIVSVHNMDILPIPLTLRTVPTVPTVPTVRAGKNYEEIVPRHFPN